MTEETTLILNELVKINEKITGMDARMTGIETKIADLDARMTGIESKIADLDARMTGIESKIADMDAEIKDIRLTLENETNRNIKLVAEGHLDLSRKLDDALKVENEKEMLMIRVNIIENELRKIKKKIEEIA